MADSNVKYFRFFVGILICLSSCDTVVAQEVDPFGREEKPIPVEVESDVGEELQTHVYRVPPTFLFGSSTEKTAKKIFESAGITFGEGTSVQYLFPNGELTVVNTIDQLELIEAYLSGPYCCSMGTNVIVIVEWIEVEDSFYHDWMFRHRISDNGTNLRMQAQKWVKSGEASIIETAIISARSGQRAKTESVREIVHPSEFGTPEIPNDLHLEGEEAVPPVSGAPISAFETRKVGTILELDPVLGADGWSIDLNLAPEVVERNGFTTWPPDDRGDPFFTISQPKLHTMKITTQVLLVNGRVGFLGTTRSRKSTVGGRKRPIVLQFVRGDISELNDVSGYPTHVERIK